MTPKPRRCVGIGPVPLTLNFPNCWVHLSDRWTQTVFHDGTEVTAVPEPSATYCVMAEELGYGADFEALSREHEILHTFLADRLTGKASPTLWAVAHGQDGCAPLWEQEAEEAVVLAFQRLLNGVSSPDDREALCETFAAQGGDLTRLLAEARRLLRGG